MRTSVERLRTGLLAGAGLLVLVIAGFLGYARYKVRRALVNLPGKLGATITKEFNGYTYSQSDGKRTVFTIHAAKAVQHTDGTYALHDVNMVLYGKRGDRADRISGDDFEYDTKQEVIRAIGIVHLDLQAPQPAGAGTAESAKHLDPALAADGTQEEHLAGGRIVHIKTSGLVYLKRLGIAATDKGIEFAFGGYTGHAVGAEYNSDTGHIVLQSAVTVSGLDRKARDGGRPIALAASHGELDRASKVAVFDNARYTSAGEIAQAELARLHLRADGSVERIEGERRVLLEDAGQGSVTSDHAEAVLDAASKPTSAVLTGNVHFVEDEPLRHTHSDSARADLGFDARGHLEHAVLAGRVHATERLRAPGGNQASSERDLTADVLDLTLAAADANAKPQLRDAKATGSARLTSIAPDATSGGPNTTRLSGDTLTARFLPDHGTAELSTVHGVGHTLVEQIVATGTRQTSAGNTLDADFRPDPKRRGAVELTTALQQGGVVIDRVLPARKATSAAPEIQHATASSASFDAGTGRLTLSGEVQMSDPASAVSAARVVMERDSGNAIAEGSVKVSYLQRGSASGSAEPVHVIAARAELDHDAARATFHGSAADGGSGLARMWQPGAGSQGGSQVEAPVLVFEQEQRRLTARSELPGRPDTVHAVLADSSSSRPASKEAMKPLHQGVARITSSLMVYSDLERQAQFSGGVRLLDATGEMRAQRATVFLAPATSAKASKPQTPGAAPGLASLFGGSIERIVATERIEIAQPGRKATGDRLVYTASDQMFVLTGTPAAPPRVVDAVQGTTTGAALRFHSGDDSVVVSGRDGDTPTRKVHTETQVKQRERK